MDSPKFKHDCNNCKFLSHVLGYDLYHCKKYHETVIARYGDKGEEYTSGIEIAKQVVSGQFPVDTKGERVEWPQSIIALGIAYLIVKGQKALN